MKKLCRLTAALNNKSGKVDSIVPIKSKVQIYLEEQNEYRDVYNFTGNDEFSLPTRFHCFYRAFL